MATASQISSLKSSAAKLQSSLNASIKAGTIKSGGSSSLKANNAGYSTTDRAGNTTYYKSAKDAPGYNDTFNGKGTTSAGVPMYTKDSTGNVITADSMQPTTPVKIPPLVAPTGTPDITSLNAALKNPTTGLNVDSSGGFTVDKITQDALSSGQTKFDKMLADLKGAEQPSAVDIQRKLDKQTGIDNLKNQEAQYTGQIDSIVKNSQAQSLALEGQGRGQTTQFLGGEQGRIQREAAVAALPVQAQLAAVQGKIQVANDYINKWGTLLMQDATNQYNQKVNTIKAVYDFGTAQDKLKFDNLASQAKAKKDADIALATAKTKAMSQALSQPGGASVISAINLATDEAGVVAALGKYNGDVLGNQIKQAQLNKLIAPEVSPMTPVQISETIQKSVSDSNPVTVKSSLATLLGSPLIGAATKARISPSLAVLNSVDELANGNVEGQFTGVGVAGRIKEGIKGLFGYKNPEAITNAQNIEAINLKVQQWASGAALTDAQTKQVDRLTPTLNDRDTTVKTKLNGLYNFMLNQAESDLLTEGVNVQFPSVNLFEISDLYAKASPEQKTLIEQTYFNK